MATTPNFAPAGTRRIAGTPFFVRTVYRAGDGSYSTVVLYSPNLDELGTVTSHSARLGLSRGWHKGAGGFQRASDSWSTLAEAATDLYGRRKAGA